MIQHIFHAADTLSIRDKPRYDKIFQRYLQPDSLPNNTFFMSYMRYRGNLDALEKECNQQFGGDIKAYLQYLAEKY